MMFNKRFLLLIVAGFILLNAGDSQYNTNQNNHKKKLQHEIDTGKKELYKIPHHINKQEQDSIARFNKTSQVALKLNETLQHKQCLEIKITEITEQSWREYWMIHFPRYKKYINSKLSASDIENLSRYINVAHFTLSCDIDTNYYKSMDEILYGPYWREFAKFITPYSHELANKYKRIRSNAENKFPYIFPECVFYEGKSIKKYTKKTNEQNKVFTESIKTGREILREKSTAPGAYVLDFNRLRNVSKIFTADVHFLVETIFIPSFFYEDIEYIDLQSPLFAPHHPELEALVNQIIQINPEIKTLQACYDKDIKNIKEHFENIKRLQESDKMEEIKILQQTLEKMSVEYTR